MIRQKLSEDEQLLEKQLSWLTISFEECSGIGIKEMYNVEEFGKLETLCSRYARSIDFLVRKIFRTLDAYEFEDQGTLVDVVNRAHKRGLVDDVEQLRIMKDLRNTIVHEYIEEELKDLFDEVLQYTAALMRMMQMTLHYIQALEK